VNRLELLLAIGTFACAVGAMVAGIFGMNLTSYLETQKVSRPAQPDRASGNQSVRACA
jgi:hypothetical protein